MHASQCWGIGMEMGWSTTKTEEKRKRECCNVRSLCRRARVCVYERKSNSFTWFGILQISWSPLWSSQIAQCEQFTDNHNIRVNAHIHVNETSRFHDRIHGYWCIELWFVSPTFIATYNSQQANESSCTYPFNFQRLFSTVVVVVFHLLFRWFICIKIVVSLCVFFFQISFVVPVPLYENFIV